MFMKDPIDRSEKLTEEISFQAPFKKSEIWWHIYISQYAKLAISLRVPGGGGKKKKAPAAPQGGASGAPAAADEEEDDYEGGLC